MQACRRAGVQMQERVAPTCLRLKEADVGIALRSTGNYRACKGRKLCPLQMAIIYLRSLTNTGSRLAPWWRRRQR